MTTYLDCCIFGILYPDSFRFEPPQLGSVFENFT